LYADLAARTERIHFYPMSIVASADDPIRISERIALLDQLTRGRVGVCFARGYQKRWIEILSQGRGATSLIDPDSDQRNREIYDDHVEAIRKSWTEDSWDHGGVHYQGPVPFQGRIAGSGGTAWRRRLGCAYGAA